MSKTLRTKGRYWEVGISRINKFTGPRRFEYPNFLAARRFARAMTKEHNIGTSVFNQYGRRVARYAPHTQTEEVTEAQGSGRRRTNSRKLARQR